MQAAAVRGVERRDVAAVEAQIARGEPRVGAALGAMAMQHVGAQFARGIAHRAACRQIARTREAPHGNARDAELQVAAALASRPSVRGSATVESMM